MKRLKKLGQRLQRLLPWNLNKEDNFTKFAKHLGVPPVTVLATNNIKRKLTVVDEIHYMAPNTTIRLEHDNLVVNSFSSNFPVIVNYKKGTITSSFLNHYTLDEDGKFEIVVSYLYYLI